MYMERDAKIWIVLSALIILLIGLIVLCRRLRAAQYCLQASILEGFNDDHCTLATREQFEAGVSRSYFEGMGQGDLLARESTSGEEYRRTYLAAAKFDVVPSDPRIQRLFGLAREGDRYCVECVKKGQITGPTSEMLAALPKVPWRFVILDDKVEGGMPHTHGNMVCLPVSFLTEEGERASKAQTQGIIKTLIHEKIHVLQRMQSDLWARTVAALGYVPIMRRKDLSADQRKRARSNPDLDDMVYSRTGYCATVYMLPKLDAVGEDKDEDEGLSTGWISLSLTEPECVDGRNMRVEEYEHPNEMVAYTLSDAIVQSSITSRW